MLVTAVLPVNMRAAFLCGGPLLRAPACRPGRGVSGVPSGPGRGVSGVPSDRAAEQAACRKTGPRSKQRAVRPAAELAACRQTGRGASGVILRTGRIKSSYFTLRAVYLSWQNQ